MKAHEQLDRIRIANGNSATQNTADAAKRLIVTASEWMPFNASMLDAEELRTVIATHLLAELADGWMCPSRLLAEIIEHQQVSLQTIQSRRERAKRDIAGAVETRRLAHQLLNDPSGCLVTVPRIPRVRKSQAEILVTALV